MSTSAVLIRREGEERVFQHTLNLSTKTKENPSINSISLRSFNADFCGNKPHGKSGLMIFRLNWHNYCALLL